MRHGVTLLALLAGACHHAKPFDKELLSAEGCEGGKPPGPDLLAAAADKSDHNREHQELLSTLGSRCEGELEKLCLIRLLGAPEETRRPICDAWRDYARLTHAACAPCAFIPGWP